MKKRIVVLCSILPMLFITITICYKFYSFKKPIVVMPINLSLSDVSEGMIDFNKPNSFFSLFIELDGAVKDQDEFRRELENVKIRMKILDAKTGEIRLNNEVYIDYYGGVIDRLVINPERPVNVPKGKHKLTISAEQGINSLIGVKQTLEGKYVEFDLELLEIVTRWVPLCALSIILFLVCMLRCRNCNRKI